MARFFEKYADTRDAILVEYYIYVYTYRHLCMLHETFYEIYNMNMEAFPPWWLFNK